MLKSRVLAATRASTLRFTSGLGNSALPSSAPVAGMMVLAVSRCCVLQGRRHQVILLVQTPLLGFMLLNSACWRCARLGAPAVRLGHLHHVPALSPMSWAHGCC